MFRPSAKRSGAVPGENGHSGNCGSNPMARQGKNGTKTARNRKPQNRHRTGFNGPSPEVGKATQFKAGNPGGPGRPRTAKFAEAARQIADELETKGKHKGMTGAQRLAQHCFDRGMKGSARHAELFISYAEGKASQAVELSGPGGGALKFENMTQADIDARIAELMQKYTESRK
jgi:hypothetical protein